MGDEKATTTAGHGSGGPAAAAKQLRERLVKELALDADQQSKLDNIFSSMRDKFAAARELPEADRAKAMERNRAEQRELISAILNPEQKKRYDEMSAEYQSARAAGDGGSGRVWVIGPDGKPQALQVRLGLTDGTMTEIVSGDIAEGTEVIAGLATPSGKSPATSGGPRMF
jgi:HlyD family secretion protein